MGLPVKAMISSARCMRWLSAGASREQIEQIAVASEAFTKFAQGAAPKKVVVVPGRLVNLVV